MIDRYFVNVNVTLASNFWSFPLAPRFLRYLTLLSYCHSQILFPLWNKVLPANFIVQDYLWECAKWMHCSAFLWIIHTVSLPWLQNSYFSFIEDVSSQQCLHLRTSLLLRPDWNSAGKWSFPLGNRIRLLMQTFCVREWHRRTLQDGHFLFICRALCLHCHFSCGCWREQNITQKTSVLGTGKSFSFPEAIENMVNFPGCLTLWLLTLPREGRSGSIHGGNVMMELAADALCMDRHRCSTSVHCFSLASGPRSAFLHWRREHIYSRAVEALLYPPNSSSKHHPCVWATTLPILLQGHCKDRMKV